MSEFTQEYTTKGGDKFQIVYQEQYNQWRVEMKDEFLSAPSLKELKEKLERKTSPKAKARKLPCLVQTNYNNLLVPAHATSIDDHHSYVRVTLATGKREQLVRTRVYSDTPDNRDISAKIAALTKKEQEISAEIRTLCTKLVAFDISKLKDD